MCSFMSRLQMGLIHHNHMLEQISAAAADEALCDSVLPCRKSHKAMRGCGISSNSWVGILLRCRLKQPKQRKSSLTHPKDQEPPSANLRRGDERSEPPSGFSYPYRGGCECTWQ